LVDSVKKNPTENMNIKLTDMAVS